MILLLNLLNTPAELLAFCFHLTSDEAPYFLASILLLLVVFDWFFMPTNFMKVAGGVIESKK
jgi:hypothetical protein